MKSFGRNSLLSLLPKSVCLFFPLISLPIHAGEIPITTNSEKAFVLLIEGRERFESLEMDSAAAYFDAAICEDSTFSLAYLYRAISSDKKDCQLYLKKAFQFKENISSGERLLIEIYTAFINKETNKIKNDLLELIKNYPFDKRVHNIAGLYLSNIGNEKEAIEHFKTAIELDNNYFFAYYNYTMSLLKTGDIWPAEENLNQALRILPNKSDLICIIGKVLIQTKDYRKANELFTNIFQNDSQCLQALSYVGHSYLLLGEFGLAKKSYQMWNNSSDNIVDRVYAKYFEALADIYQDKCEDARLVVKNLKTTDNNITAVSKLIEFYDHPSLISNSPEKSILENRSEVILKMINNYECASSRFPFLMKTFLFTE